MEAKKFNIDIKEYLEDFCTFCEQEQDRIIYKTDNFTVWLSLGQIVEGYCLIIPNDHYHCMGALPKALHEEYLSLKLKVRKILTTTYGGCIFYEHGRVGVCNVQPGEQLCYHAHIHAVPIKNNLLPFFEEDLVPIELTDYEEIFEYYKKLGHYLFYENAEGKPYIFFVNQPIRRQYLRYLAAKSIGNEDLASWDKYPGWEHIYNAKKKLIPCFKKLEEEYYN